MCGGGGEQINLDYLVSFRSFYDYECMDYSVKEIISVSVIQVILLEHQLDIKT